MFGTLHKKDDSWVVEYSYKSLGDPNLIGNYSINYNEEEIQLLKAPLPLLDGVSIDDVLSEGNVVEFTIVVVEDSKNFAKIINIKSEDYPNSKLKEAKIKLDGLVNKTLEGAANSYAASTAINGVDAKLVRRDFKAGAEWKMKNIESENIIISKEEWDQIQKN